jgi:4'-phosphopantetheinyl transferase
MRGDLTTAANVDNAIGIDELGTMAVWWAELDLPGDEIDAALRELSLDERERADRFYRAIHRNRFIAARGFLRRVLARYLNLAPSVIRFDYGENGKPRLGENLSGEHVYFNVAHSEDRAVVAVNRNSEVGVDLERICPKPNCLDIARRFFADEERAALAQVDGEERLQAFYRCWTRKEAYVKAIGAGLSIRLDSFAVSITAEKISVVKNVSSAGANPCTLVDVSRDRGFAASLAIPGPVHCLPRVAQFCSMA